MNFASCDEHALDRFWRALHAADAVNDTNPHAFETGFDVDGDWVDGHGTEIVNALLAHGWRPPSG